MRLRWQMVVPWAIAVGAVAAAAVMAVEREGPRERRAQDAAMAEPGATTAAPAPVPSAMTLDRCAARLEDTKALLQKCERAVSSSRPPAAPCGVATCLRDPQVRAVMERAAGRGASRASAGSGSAPAEGPAPEQRRAIARSILKDALDLKPEQARWVNDYVCAAREQRAAAMRQLQTGAATTDVLGQLHRDRQSLLRDLEAYLGAEKYKTFRSIGGIGLMTEASGCD